jgi:hypothetical protein
MASGNATNPIVFEPMVMSMVLFLQKRINELEKQLSAIHKQAIGPKPERQNSQAENQPNTQTDTQTNPSGGGQSRLY